MRRRNLVKQNDRIYYLESKKRKVKEVLNKNLADNELIIFMQ